MCDRSPQNHPRKGREENKKEKTNDQTQSPKRKKEPRNMVSGKHDANTGICKLHGKCPLDAMTFAGAAVGAECRDIGRATSHGHG